jgi:S-adenosylmethionine hydrolase
MPVLSRSWLLGATLLVCMSVLAPASALAAVSPNICLFTDYGWDDPYVAQLKGAILTINPSARLIDLTHTVAPFNVTEGAYLLDECAEEFPAGTIFVAVVDPQVGTERDAILVESAKQKFYVGPDNGLLAQVIRREGLLKAWKLDKPEAYRNGDVSHTFHGRDIFGPVAAHLSAGDDPDRLGTPLKSLALVSTREPTFSGGMISTEVLHVDHYGNIILNLRSDSDLAAKFHQGTLTKISVGRESYSAPLVKTYGDVTEGRLLLLYGSSGQLEIGMNQGSAAKKMHVEPGATILLKP